MPNKVKYEVVVQLSEVVYDETGEEVSRQSIDSCYLKGHPVDFEQDEIGEAVRVYGQYAAEELCDVHEVLAQPG